MKQIFILQVFNCDSIKRYMLRSVCLNVIYGAESFQDLTYVNMEHLAEVMSKLMTYC